MLSFGPIRDANSLKEILALQIANLPSTISGEEAVDQGFVTVAHSVELLTAMNEPHHHSGAWYENRLVGYALVMETRFKDKIPVLFPMFELLDGIPYKGKRLADWPYFVMGQICIDKPFRGQGIFSGLYQDLKSRLSAHFELVVTEIATRNTRSIRAHEKVGFERIYNYTDPDGEEWDIVALPLR
jgi:GNAT superfamily N-acetyltransferase